LFEVGGCEHEDLHAWGAVANLNTLRKQKIEAKNHDVKAQMCNKKKVTRRPTQSSVI
jgi:hypothetical protein